MSGIVIVLVIAATVAIGMQIVRRSQRIIRKRHARIVVIALAVILGLAVGYYFPSEPLFPTFPSLEAAFESQYPEETLTEDAIILQGEHTAMVFVPTENSTALKTGMYYEESGKWRVVGMSGFSPEWHGFLADNQLTGELFRCDATGECFLHLMNLRDVPLTISDSLGSRFEQYNGQYFACLGEVSEGYFLEVNGETVSIPALPSP